MDVRVEPAVGCRFSIPDCGHFLLPLICPILQKQTEPMVVDSVADPVPTATYTPSLLAYVGLLGWAGWRRRLITVSS